MNARALPVAAGLAFSIAALHAHHSLSGIYDTSRRITIEGTIREFHFINPHPYVMLDGEDRAGESHRWRLELDNRSELVRIGMNEDTLKEGDVVVATGNPGRNDQPNLYVYRLQRPSDNLLYEQIGSTPRIRIP